MTFVSRRDLLRRAAAVGAFGAVAPDEAGPREGAGEANGLPASPAAFQAAQPRREALENLTATEMDLLEAIVARLIPSDATGPGATGRAPRTTSTASSAARCRPSVRHTLRDWPRSIAMRAHREGRRSRSCRRWIRIRC